MTLQDVVDDLTKRAELARHQYTEALGKVDKLGASQCFGKLAAYNHAITQIKKFAKEAVKTLSSTDEDVTYTSLNDDNKG